MRDLIEDGDGIFKLARQTLECPIELNDNSIAVELRMPHVNLNVTIYKVYAHNIDEAWLYENHNLLNQYKLNISIY